MNEQVAYGFDLEPRLRRLLRGPLRADTRQWVERVTDALVMSAVPLEGGTSSALHRLAMSNGAEVVVRDYVLDWVAQEPWIPFDEVHNLLRLRTSKLPVPAVIAADPGGTVVGRPLTLMSAVPGHVDWRPDNLERWLVGLVNMLVTIHAVNPVGWSAVYRPFEPAPIPSWTEHPTAWATAHEAAVAALPARPLVVVHRDFHPGNLLWTHGSVSGIVDWAGACLGPAEADVAHCRINLASAFGLDVADRFLNLWLRASGRDSYDRVFDLAEAASMSTQVPDRGLDDIVRAAIS